MKAKISLVFGSISILFLMGCATEFKITDEDVPQTVITAFQSRYASVMDVSWEVEKEDGHLLFEAEWKENGKEKEAYFKSDGTFVKEE
jgi:uncharacterized lipoprotein YmbA